MNIAEICEKRNDVSSVEKLREIFLNIKNIEQLIIIPLMNLLGV